MHSIRLFPAVALLVVLPLSSTTVEAQRSARLDAALDQCRRPGGDRDGFVEERQSGFRPSGTIRGEAGRNGSIAVLAWDRDSVHVHSCIHVRTRSDREGRAIAGDVSVVTAQNEVRVVMSNDATDFDSSVRIVMLVPRRSDLALTARNGALSADGVSGRLELETRNGPLALRDLAGDVRGRTENGPLHVSLSGRRWDGAGLDAQTTNGPMTLLIPDGYSAHLITGTSNGPLSMQIPVTMRQWDGRHIETQLGDGGAPVRVVTRSGPANIRRANDSR